MQNCTFYFVLDPNTFVSATIRVLNQYLLPKYRSQIIFYEISTTFIYLCIQLTLLSLKTTKEGDIVDCVPKINMQKVNRTKYHCKFELKVTNVLAILTSHA